ncbi:MAG: protein TolQ [Deltaproteobacteria bacterium]|nr:protein TolQ [Deltaproteobacteria bacterium]
MIHIPFVVQIPAGLSLEVAFGHDIVQMILHAGPVVKFVLVLLLFFSFISWAIIFVKFRLLSKAKWETENFLDIFWGSRDFKKIFKSCEHLTFSPVACVFRAGYTEFTRIRRIQAVSNKKEGRNMSGEGGMGRSQQALMDNLERAVRKGTIDQMNRMERAVSFLATTGNTAPFIGLFGTVWGIMESFRGIGLKGSANLAVVAPGISEALIATAAGLAAAIPAVVAFNYFTHRISALRAEMDIFASDFLSAFERQFFRKHGA